MDSSGIFEYLLRLGDNCLILSQRLSEWCGHGPVLEEDIALTNIALDLLGQARFWLSYAGEVEGAGRDEDQLAFLRDSGQFRNVLLVEQPNGDYAITTARQFYFDSWHFHLLSALQKSSDARIAAIAEKAIKEVTYHLERSTDWVIRLGDGTDESHRRMQNAADELWMYTGELFEMDDLDREMAAAASELISRLCCHRGRRMSRKRLRKQLLKSHRANGCSAAANAACIRRISAICSQKCSFCSEPIPVRNGSRAPNSRRGLDLARSNSRSGDSGSVHHRSRHCA